MNKTQSLQDIEAIKSMMENSTRFLSLSGLSGIVPGIFAIIGSAYAYFIVLNSGSILYDEKMHLLNSASGLSEIIHLAITALVIFTLAVCSAWYFTWKKAKKNNSKLWSSSFKKWLFHFSIPLIVGGIFSLLLIYHHNVHLVGSATLIFYGLALVNASKYTFQEIHYLGLSEIFLGLLAGIFLCYGILFWTLGFGLLHIVYGITMYIKHK